jgi:hypothetical protein
MPGDVSASTTNFAGHHVSLSESQRRLEVDGRVYFLVGEQDLEETRTFLVDLTVKLMRKAPHHWMYCDKEHAAEGEKATTPCSCGLAGLREHHRRMITLFDAG